MRPGVGSVDDARADVVRRLRARRGELLEALFARVREGALAGAGEGDAEYLAGLHAAVGAVVEYLLRELEVGEGRAGPIPVAALEQARRAARVGVSLDTVLRRYVVGSALLGEFVMEEADRSELPEAHSALRRAVRAQAAVLDRLLEAITVEYGDELEQAGRSPERRRYERIRTLLDGGASEGASLGYELDGWHLGLIATGAGTGAADVVRGLTAELERPLLSVEYGRGSVWAWLGGRERFAGGELERIRARAPAGGMEVVLALGEPNRGLEGWRLTHRQAQAALLVALHMPAPAGISRYADVALLAAALKDEMLARALIDVYLAPLDDHRHSGPVLRETLRAYIAAEHNASSAAAALNVVRTTVVNRLRTIEERLGRTLHPCPAELIVALHLDELGVSSAAEPPDSER
jgi:PucR C-terminal helix-turn-helix domain/GGDEF-like domain